MNVLTRSVPATLKGLEIYTINNFIVEVDPAPIGGYRGPAGALMIRHKENKVLREWEKSECKEAAELIQKCIDSYASAYIYNVLLFAKEDQGQFKFSITPYPTCSLIEKLQGLFHAIFGSPVLNQKQKDTIKTFYKERLNQRFDFTAPKKTEQTDAFCKQAVLDKQTIRLITKDKKNYHILYDNCPKGNVKSDPHFLIVPEGSAGHECGNRDDRVKQRAGMLYLAKNVLKVLSDQKKYETLIYLERNGLQLQGVPHTHCHVQGIEHFPKTPWEKIKAFVRLLWPARLTNDELKAQVEKYKKLTPS
jgi:diadenosine tetraphosphate (Ap4A) HIT family hydrolase